MARLLELDPGTMTEEPRRVDGAIASGPRGGTCGPRGIWVHRLEFANLAPDRLIDLVGKLGYYILISITINVFELEHPTGRPDALRPV